MQKISYWAHCHVNSARFLIVTIKILLAALAYYTGMALYKMQLVLAAAEIYFFAFVLMVAAVIFYPRGKKTTVSKKLFYLRQKACDFILPLCAVLVFTAWVNNADVVNTNAAYGSSIIKHPTAQQILNSGKTKDALTSKEKRILKKEFFNQLKVYASATVTGNKAKAGEALKTILAIIALVGLLYLLAALVCSLSCGGSDVAAVIIGVLGLAGLIWGFIALIKAINHKGKKSGSLKLE
jgi:hypothetical protein